MKTIKIFRCNEKEVTTVHWNLLFHFIFGALGYRRDLRIFIPSEILIFDWRKRINALITKYQYIAFVLHFLEHELFGPHLAIHLIALLYWKERSTDHGKISQVLFFTKSARLSIKNILQSFFMLDIFSHLEKCPALIDNAFNAFAYKRTIE